MNAHEDLIPIDQLFFDDAGPHILRVGSGSGPRYTPARGHELQALIGATIAQLGGVAGGTRKTPTHLTPPVPIETLLYRGRAALDRALEIRAARASGKPLDSATVDELLDLIALAVEE